MALEVWPAGPPMRLGRQPVSRHPSTPRIQPGSGFFFAWLNLNILGGEINFAAGTHRVFKIHQARARRQLQPAPRERVAFIHQRLPAAHRAHTK